MTCVITPAYPLPPKSKLSSTPMCTGNHGVVLTISIFSTAQEFHLHCSHMLSPSVMKQTNDTFRQFPKKTSYFTHHSLHNTYVADVLAWDCNVQLRTLCVIILWLIYPHSDEL